MEKEVQLAKVAQALNTLAARAYDVGRYFVTIDQVDNCRSRNYQRNFIGFDVGWNGSRCITRYFYESMEISRVSHKSSLRCMSGLGT